MWKKMLSFCVRLTTRIMLFLLWGFFRFGELLFGAFAKWLGDLIKKPFKP
jgi:hypothetical protein